MPCDLIIKTSSETIQTQIDSLHTFIFVNYLKEGDDYARRKVTRTIIRSF